MAFDEDRYYSHDTHPFIPIGLGALPSVTTICQAYPRPWMFNWMKKVGSEEAAKQSEVALAIGDRVHALVHALAKGEAIDLTADPQPVKWAIEAYQKWADQHQVQVVDTEQVVFSAKHRYAGRLDLVAWVDGQLALLDVKTSKAIYAEHVIQVVAYAEAYQASRPRLVRADGKPLTALYVLRLGKTDGQFDPQEVTDYWDAALEEFLRLRGTWEFNRRWQKHDPSLRRPRQLPVTIRPWTPRTPAPLPDPNDPVAMWLHLVAQHKLSLAAYLSACLCTLHDGVLKIVPKVALHREVLEYPEHRRLLMETLKAQFGQTVQLQIADA